MNTSTPITCSHRWAPTMGRVYEMCIGCGMRRMSRQASSARDADLSRSPDRTLFRSLVASFAAQEPVHGYLHSDELPELTRADVQLLCRVYERDVVEELDFDRLVQSVQLPSAVATGDAVFSLIEQMCRRLLLRDVQDECARQDEFLDDQDDEVIRHG